MVSKKKNTADFIMNMIIDDIRLKKFPDGNLNASALSDRYEIGMSICREALHRLSEKGVVSFSPNKGYSIPVDYWGLQLDAIRFFEKLIPILSEEIINNFTYEWAGKINSNLAIYKMLCLEYDQLKGQLADGALKGNSRSLEDVLLDLDDIQQNMIASFFYNCNKIIRKVISMQQISLLHLPPVYSYVNNLSNYKGWYHDHLPLLDNMVKAIMIKSKEGLIKAFQAERKHLRESYLKPSAKKDQI